MALPINTEPYKFDDIDHPGKISVYLRGQECLRLVKAESWQLFAVVKGETVCSMLGHNQHWDALINDIKSGEYLLERQVIVSCMLPAAELEGESFEKRLSFNEVLCFVNDLESRALVNCNVQIRNDALLGPGGYLIRYLGNWWLWDGVKRDFESSNWDWRQGLAALINSSMSGQQDIDAGWEFYDNYRNPAHQAFTTHFNMT